MGIPLVVILVIGGVLPIVIAWRFGALGIPRNDDWSYLIASFRFANGEGINGNNWALMNLVGQLVLALPINIASSNRVAPLQILVASLGVAGLFALYDLATHWLTKQRALFAVCLLALGPLWAALAGSFMTDIPTFALSMICLAAGARALKSQRHANKWLTVALIAGFVGFAIRQYAIVAIITLIVVAVWHRTSLGSRRFRVIVGSCLLTLAFAFVFYKWRLQLPGFDDPPLVLPSTQLIDRGIEFNLRSATLIGFLVAPAVLLVGPLQLLSSAFMRSPKTTVIFGVGMIAMFTTWLARANATDRTLFITLGNYFRSAGILGNDVIAGVRPDLLPEPLMIAFACIGITSFTVFSIAGASTAPRFINSLRVRKRNQTPGKSVAVVAMIGFGLTSGGPVFFGMPIYDRYLLIVIGLVSVLVLSAPALTQRTRTVNRSIAGVAFGFMAALGLVFACNSASFDGARWRAAERATSITGDHGQVDGGFEWTNYYAQRQVFFSPERSSSRYCIQLTSSPESQTGWQGISEPVWGIFGTQAWIVAEQRNPC